MMPNLCNRAYLFNLFYNYVLLLTNDPDKISKTNPFRVSAYAEFLIWGPLMRPILLHGYY